MHPGQQAREQVDRLLGRPGGQLRQTDDTLDAVARQVGYADGFGLSQAFKRVKGASPGQYRRRATTPEAR
ncbi:MAG: helix-turn-helix domain-containing protein [Stackebrandtia sp.]